ncbi:LacI family transcriptional regulator [Spirochaetia bacterium]|nr:LacI family transcriptional regulator [Spirochaetia bacterium]
MSIKIRDVAKLAGVSTATVSRVINDPEKVRSGTRQRVESAISKSNYRPNYFARGLNKGFTDSVGILASYAINPYFTEIVNAIEQVLSQNGVYIYLCSCETNTALEKRYTEDFLERNTDAIIAIESPSMNTVDNYFLNKQFKCPIILVNQHIEPFGDNYVVRCDQEPGVWEMFEQVRFRNLFPFCLFLGKDASYSFLLKEALLKKWKKKYHVSDKDAQIIHLEKMRDTSGEDAVWHTHDYFRKVLATPARPRAVLAGNELMALGILVAARELGIAVPEELAVVGIDNTLLSRTCSPPLTTIDLHMKDIGQMAANLYMNIRKNPDKKQEKVHIIPSNLSYRKTF